jgi:hypothetical protein
VSFAENHAKGMEILTLAITGDHAGAIEALDALGLTPEAATVVAVILASAVGGVERGAQSIGVTPLEFIQRMAVRGQTR